MKIIRDAIHGTISVDELSMSLLDTAEMQRLRGVKQLGFAYLVYPTATHTRFEHSLGTYHLAQKMGQALGLSEKSAEKTKIAALLHDIGHGPFSHTTEFAVSEHVNVMHEQKTQELIQKSSIADILKKGGFSSKEISDIAVGKSMPLGTIISSQIDVDRMDYLVRDAYYTGAAYGVIDLERLILTATMHNNKLCMNEDGLTAVESMVFARYLMYPSVYQHHASRIASSMFSAAIIECLKEGLFTVDELYDMDDIELISRLRLLSTFSGEMMQRLEQRKLYKRACIIDRDEFGNGYKKLLILNSQKLESLQIEITEACDMKQGEVLLDIPQPLYATEETTEIIRKGKAVSISEISPLLKALHSAQWSYWNVGVYCDKKNIAKVGKKAQDVLLGYTQ